MFVDYLQQVRVPGAKDEYQRITTAINELSLFARDHEIALMVATQPNREGQKAETLKMYHAKGSNAIDAAAGVCLTLARESGDSIILGAIEKSRYQALNGSATFRITQSKRGGRLRSYDPLNAQ